MVKRCVLCGKEYKYCPSCPKDANKESWYAIYDSENCKDIAKTLTNYKFDKITKEEARELLSMCDLSIDMKEKYRIEINAIMAKPKRMARPKVEVEVIEEKPVVIEEQPVFKEIQPVVEEAKEEPIGVVETE